MFFKSLGFVYLISKAWKKKWKIELHKAGLFSMVSLYYLLAFNTLIFLALAALQKWLQNRMILPMEVPMADDGLNIRTTVRVVGLLESSINIKRSITSISLKGHRFHFPFFFFLWIMSYGDEFPFCFNY